MLAIMEFKSYLFAGVLAWLLQMILFAPAFYYVSRFVAHKLFARNERQQSL